MLKKIILLAGPTASGKSKLAVKLADYFNGEMINHLREVKEPTSVNFLPGSAIYSRIALEKNNFNPNLNSNEERELGYRIKKTGFEMKILPFVMAKHKRRFNVGGLIEFSVK